MHEYFYVKMGPHAFQGRICECYALTGSNQFRSHGCRARVRSKPFLPIDTPCNKVACRWLYIIGCAYKHGEKPFHYLANQFGSYGFQGGMCECYHKGNHDAGLDLGISHDASGTKLSRGIL